MIQLERIAINHDNFGCQAWPDHRQQQQQRNESAHKIPIPNWIRRQNAEVSGVPP
jgi:hypothetical protein